jgi:hypothetical protein
MKVKYIYHYHLIVGDVYKVSGLIISDMMIDNDEYYNLLRRRVLANQGLGVAEYNDSCFVSLSFLHAITEEAANASTDNAAPSQRD